MKRVIAIVTSLMMVVCFLWSGEAFAAATDFSVMRVKLTSMGTPTKICITVDGNYSIPEKPQISLEKEAYTISITNGQLVLSKGTTSVPMGTSFTIKRHTGTGTNQLTISNSSYGKTNYLGNFEVKLIDNKYIQLINCIYLETYLYGVVPYEMSNAFPIEALKAQAIAARTFAVKCYPNIVDTTWAQVYRGYNPLHTRAIQAVNETAKQVRTTNGVLIGANYSASNGGQTEIPSNAWLSGNNSAYNVMKDDPYDLQNTSSRVQKLTFPKVVTVTSMPGNMYSILQNELISSLDPTVYSTLPSDVVIKEVRGLNVCEPYNGQGQTVSKRMTIANFSLFFVVKNISIPAVPVLEPTVKSISITIESMKTILLSRDGFATRLFTVVDNKAVGAFELMGTGWGHGVGMSQRGAQQRANAGKIYNDILDFYYPNTLKALVVANPTALTSKPVVPKPTPIATPKPTPIATSKPTPIATSKPTPTPTPKPTTVPPAVIKTMGTVKVSASLNIRSGPGTSYKIVGTLRNGSQIEILTHNSSWYKIKSGTVTGYVMGTYVKIASPAQNPPHNPSPVTLPAGIKYGVVTTSKLNIRSGASTANKIVGYVLIGKRVAIFASVNGWYKISYVGLSGYVSASYVRLESTVVQASKPVASVQATVIASSLRLRSAPSITGTILKSLIKGQKVTILGKTGSWVKVRSSDGKIGYVMGIYIK